MGVTRKTVADKYKASKVERAKKRLPDVEYLGDGQWVVKGNSKLGDEYEEYRVKFWQDTLKYSCTCQQHVGGEVRKICTHRIACQLHKEEHGYRIAERSIPTGIGPGDQESDAPDQPTNEGSGGIAEDSIPLPNDPRFGQPPLPEWVTSFREPQWDAILEIQEAYANGADVVLLDAPTGSGKTLIGEVARRILSDGRRSVHGAYVCNNLQLQDQFLHDFPYAKVLKGRTNYPTQVMPFPVYTAGDCTNERGMAEDAECNWCPAVRQCAYNVARKAALASDLMVINTAYLLNEANGPGWTSGRELVVLDEADTLEEQLMGYVTYTLSKRLLDKLNLVAPKKGSHMETIGRWLENELLPTIKSNIKALNPRSDDVQEVRFRKQLERLVDSTGAVLDRLFLEADDESEDRTPVEGWVRDYGMDEGGDTLVLKPIKVDWAGPDYLWQHGQKWLCMSASFVSAQEFIESTGLDKWQITSTATGADGMLEHTTRPARIVLVRHPMMFPVENRLIRVSPVANVVAKNKTEAYPQLARAVEVLADEYPDDRILVHTVSYDLARYLYGNCMVSGRGVVYLSAGDRDAAIHRYLANPGSILFASSLDRGADFKHDQCRVVILAKMPFPYLGDRQISQRKNSKGGNLWYAVQTIRKIVQMTGRGVRSETDYCDTYILDAQFGDNVMKRNGHLLPDWWSDAIDRSYRPNTLRDAIGATNG